MNNLSVLLVNAVVTLFGFFAVAPVVMSAVSSFGVQKTFARVMVEEGVIKEDDVTALLPKKQIAGVAISLLVLVALFLTARRVEPYGYICAVAGMGGGFLKYRKVLQFNSLTVRRFQNTFKDSYDAKKLNAYVDKHF